MHETGETRAIKGEALPSLSPLSIPDMTKPYQDEWVKGQVVQAGYRECANRYALIVSTLEHLRRPFTVLDLGACSGYFAHRLASELDCRVTAVDSDPDLLRVAEANGDPRVTVIPRRLTTNEILRLGSFDVMLALSVFHHFTDWYAAYDVARTISRALLIVETADPAENHRSAVSRAMLGPLYQLISHGGKLIGEAPGVWDRQHRRGIFAIFGFPVQLVGRVVTQRLRPEYDVPPIATHQLSADLVGIGRPIKQLLGPPTFDVAGQVSLWPAYIEETPVYVSQSERGQKGVEIFMPKWLALNTGDQVVLEVGVR